MIIIMCDKCHKQVYDIELIKVTTSVRCIRINDPAEESLHFHKECWRRIKQFIATGA